MEQALTLEKQNTHPGTNGHAGRGERICAKPGCGARLGETNQSGCCRRHFHYSKRGKRTNGHAAAGRARNGINASPRMAPRDPQPTQQLMEDRVNQVILAWPPEDKLRIVNAWLSGGL